MKPPRQAGPRGAARLAAAQALYRLELSDDANSADFVVDEFVDHWLNREVEGATLVAADRDLFADLVRGTWRMLGEIDVLLADVVTPEWPIERLTTILRATLRLGAYELVARPDIPAAVIITEYVDVAHAFFDGAEPGLVNGALDRLARLRRAAEMEAKRGDRSATSETDT